MVASCWVQNLRMVFLGEVPLVKKYLIHCVFQSWHALFVQRWHANESSCPITTSALECDVELLPNPNRAKYEILGVESSAGGGGIMLCELPGRTVWDRLAARTNKLNVAHV